MAEFSKKKISTEVPVYPLSESIFERMNSLNPPSLRSLKTPVVWNEDVYALGRDWKGNGKLYKYSLSSNEWSNFSVSSSIYASYSVLATYNSELLLISGMDLTLWEFNNSDFAFRESCIKPIPSKYCSHVFDIHATSSDEYLIIIYETWNGGGRQHNLLIYNGRDWKIRQLEGSDSLTMNIHKMAIDSHAVYDITHCEWRNDIHIERALIPSYDEIKDEDIATIRWETLEKMLLEEFDELLRGSIYSIIIQDQQFYFVDSKGIIFTAFLQPPILPIVWGNSGINFQQAPHLVGLPDRALLMIGTIIHQDGTQLDVIKINQKDHEYNPDSHLTMKALVTLERGMNIPVLTKLQSRWPWPWTEFDYIESWINSTPEPTWRDFFRMLKETSPELGELVYQIKEIFHGEKHAVRKIVKALLSLGLSVIIAATEAAADTAKLKAQLIQLQSSSKSADEMASGLESSVALCENILQKMQKSDEEREQLAKQLQSKAEEVTKLNEQLKLYEKAEDENKTRQLTNKDLPLLLCQLKLHAAKWREIGIHLGFLTGELATIEARPNLSQSAPLSWLVVMFEEWLQWAPGDSRGSTSFATVTLEDLKSALNETGLGASAHNLTLQGIQTTSSILLKPKATSGIPENCTGKEIVDSNKPLQVPCSDDQQDFTDTPSSSDTRLTSPEMKKHQCLVQ